MAPLLFVGLIVVTQRRQQQHQEGDGGLGMKVQVKGKGIYGKKEEQMKMIKSVHYKYSKANTVNGTVKEDGE